MKEQKEQITEQNILSEEIIKLQNLDLQEYEEQVKNRGYHLSRFIKREMIVRSAQAGCAQTSFKVNAKAARALIGTAFITEDGSLSYFIKPLDRDTFVISFKMNSSKMTNAQIYWYNATYDLNIPLNEEIETCPDDEQIDTGFIKSKILKIQKG